MGVRTAGKGHKVTSVSNGDSDDEQYNMEERSPVNPYPPAAFPVQGLKRHMAHFQDGESAHHYREGSMPKKAKRSKNQSNEKKGSIKKNNKKRSHTKMKAATNLAGERRREYGLGFLHNMAASKTDSTFQATKGNGTWPNESHLNKAQGSNKRRRAADDGTDYHQDREFHPQGLHGSRKAKTRKTA